MSEHKQIAGIKPVFKAGASLVTTGFHVEFYRNDIRQFDVVAKSHKLALELQEVWQRGGGQGELAEIIHNNR
jgi:hypothetical protein